MDKKEKRGIFVVTTRNAAKKRINKEFQNVINKREKREGRKLTKEEKKELRTEFHERRGKQIIKEEARRARVKVTAIGLSALVLGSGITGALVGTHNSKIKGITDGKAAIEINMDEVQKNIEVKNVADNKESKHALFVKDLQEAAVNGEATQNKEIEEETKQEIESLENSDEVLEYVKKLYVAQYNRLNKDQIDTKDIKFSKSKANKVLYKDEAQNGDEILRVCTDSEAKDMKINRNTDYSEISVKIDTENVKKEERVGYNGNKFVTLYGKDEEVVADQHTILCDLGEVALQGINTSISMDQKDTSSEIKEEYKEKFIKAVIDYKKSNKELLDVKNNNKNNQTKDDGLEIGD